jgi:hypothetical protein
MPAAAIPAIASAAIRRRNSFIVERLRARRAS